MRIIWLLIIIMSVAAAKAQTVMPGSYINPNYSVSRALTLPLQDSGAKKKWSFSKYTGLSAGYSFFRGGSASVVAVPVGLQISRPLTNNLYAFAGISAAPAFIGFNSNTFLSSNFNKSNPASSFLRSGSFGVYSRAEVGLMYVNPERTFSISGSIGVEKSSSPLFYYPVNAVSPNGVAAPIQR